jgi:hypothetical protein
MGIETALVLSYAATAAQVIGAAGAAYGAVEAGKNKPAISVPKPDRPQASKAPDLGAAAAANAAAAGAGGALAGNSGTFLTGPGGVDASMLNLGKNKLLGQ